MGWLFNTKEESADIRGVPDEALSTLTDTQVILIALARLYEGQGMDDRVLIDEMYRRGGANWAKEKP